MKTAIAIILALWLTAPAHAANNGRYVIVTGEGFVAFLVDTQTGKVWSYVKFTNLEGQPFAFKYVDRIDNPRELV